jgi:hypothetical protein
LSERAKELERRARELEEKARELERKERELERKFKQNASDFAIYMYKRERESRKQTKRENIPHMYLSGADLWRGRRFQGAHAVQERPHLGPSRGGSREGTRETRPVTSEEGPLSGETGNCTTGSRVGQAGPTLPPLGEHLR